MSLVLSQHLPNPKPWITRSSPVMTIWAPNLHEEEPSSPNPTFNATSRPPPQPKARCRMIKNYLSSPKQTQPTSHGGTGPVDFYKIWPHSDFQSKVDYMNRFVIPPG